MTEAPDGSDKPEGKPLFTGIVRPILEKDLETLKPILETWIKDSDTGELLSNEVAEDLQIMRNSVGGANDRVYLVAEAENGGVVGVIGFRNPDKRMLPFAKTAKPVELVNAFVAKEERTGKGTGTALVKAVEEEAKKRGYTEIIFNSGPRYKDTAWGFYNKLYGQPVAIAEKYYGEGGDAPVWRKELYVPEESEEFSIKKAEESDLEGLWNLIDSCSDSLVSQGFDHWKRYYTKARVQHKIKSQQVFILQEQGKLVASVTLDTKKVAYFTKKDMASFAEPDSPAIYITALATLPERQGAGLGSKLVEFAESETKKKGINFIRFDCRADITSLVNFYKKRGYREVGNYFDESHNHNKEAYLLMEKNL